jgi:hypothetical protein
MSGKNEPGKRRNSGSSEPEIIIDTRGDLSTFIKIGEKEIKVILDTGSKINIVNSKFLKTIPHQRLHHEDVPIRFINGETTETMGVVLIKAVINKRNLEMKAFEVKEATVPLLIGLPTIRDAKMTINLNNSFIEEKEKEKKVKVAHFTEIPARSQIWVPVKASLSSDCYFIEPREQFKKNNNLIIGRSLTRFDGTRGLISVINLNNQPVKIWPNTVIALAEKGYSVNYVQNIREEQYKEIHYQLGDELNEEEIIILEEILKKNRDCFAADITELTVTDRIEHDINTGDHLPIKKWPYRIAPIERREIQRQVKEMLDQGIIEESKSPWASPVVLVKKKTGEFRFCIDYRQLNNITKKDAFPLPRIQDLLDSVGGAKYFTTLDMKSGYHAIPMKKEDREKTAFVTPDGHFQYKVMPFGLTNAPSTYQKMITTLFAGKIWKNCLAYLDDVIIYTQTFDDHLEEIKEVFNLLREANLKLNPEKCVFAAKEVKYLGHIIAEKGITPDPSKVQAVMDFPRPTTVKEIRSFIGLSSYYRKFIKNFAQISGPIVKLTKKDQPYKWREEQEESFKQLKQALCDAPVLTHLMEECEVELHTDASGFGIGVVLVQKEAEGEKVLGYASRRLSKAEINYTITEKECLAIVYGIAQFRPYLYGRKFTIVTDHCALCWLTKVKNPNGRVCRWSLMLQEYNYEVRYKTGRKHLDADCLSRAPIETEEVDDNEIWRIDLDEDELQDFRDEQIKDKQVKKIIERLQKGIPDKKYRMKNQLLYHQRNKQPIHQLRVVVPIDIRPRILEENHDHSTAGHLGITRTIDRISKKYYWPKMKQYIYHYVRTCKKCQMRKGTKIAKEGLLIEMTIATEPFEKIGIDHLGPFPKSDEGNKHIIVAIDYHTKWVEIEAVPDTSAYFVIKFLKEKIINQHKKPKQIITDLSSTFRSKFFTSELQELEIKHLKTSGYHPRTNGLVERFNRTITDMISFYTSETQKDWDVELKNLQFAYNTSKQESTQASPYQLLHGNDPVTSKDQKRGVETHELTPEQTETLRQKVIKNMKKIQTKSKERFDRGRSSTIYRPGDKVLLYVPTRKKGRSEKLLTQFKGPYEVVERIYENNYKILDRKTTKKMMVPVERMKRFHVRIDERPEVVIQD